MRQRAAQVAMAFGATERRHLCSVQGLLQAACSDKLLAVSSDYLQKKGAELQCVQGESLNELRKQGFQRRIKHFRRPTC